MKHVHEQSPEVIKRRKRYDLGYKARVVYRFHELIEQNQGVEVWGTKSEVAREFKIGRDLVKKWLDNKDLVVGEVWGGTEKKKKCVYKVEKQKFKDQEEMLFDAVYIRRQLYGLWVDRYWLCDEFAEILEASKPDGWDSFKFSKGWIWNFCKRFGITKQCATNKKDIPISVKQSAVRNFHRTLLEVQRGTFDEHTHKPFGRFDGYRMFHWDQSPVEFALPGKSTLNIRGTPCWMWHPGSGTEKRFISVQLCIRPWGEQIVKPVIIFRGG